MDEALCATVILADPWGNDLTIPQTFSPIQGVVNKDGGWQVFLHLVTIPVVLTQPQPAQTLSSCIQFQYFLYHIFLGINFAFHNRGLKRYQSDT